MTRIAVLGLGLIGGSLLRRLAATHDDGHDANGYDVEGYDVIGYDVDAATRRLARASGLPVRDAAAVAVRHAEVVMLAVPMAEFAGAVEQVAPLLSSSVVLTDVGSVKRPAYDVIRRLGRPERFVGGHPMAGTEHSGFAASSADLFTGAAWVLCLEPDTDVDRWVRLARLITGLGCRVVPATSADHDAAVARISHLPHLLAAALAIGAAEAGPLALALAAGSFRDATRVAATRPELTAAICAANRGEVEPALAELIERLQASRDHRSLLEAGRAARLLWQPGDTAVVRRKLRIDSSGLADRLLALGRAGGWVEAATGVDLSLAGPPGI